MLTAGMVTGAFLAGVAFGDKIKGAIKAKWTDLLARVLNKV